MGEIISGRRGGGRDSLLMDCKLNLIQDNFNNLLCIEPFDS